VTTDSASSFPPCINLHWRKLETSRGDTASTTGFQFSLRKSMCLLLHSNLMEAPAKSTILREKSFVEDPQYIGGLTGVERS